MPRSYLLSAWLLAGCGPGLSVILPSQTPGCLWSECEPLEKRPQVLRERRETLSRGLGDTAQTSHLELFPESALFLCQLLLIILLLLQAQGSAVLSGDAEAARGTRHRKTTMPGQAHQEARLSGSYGDTLWSESSPGQKEARPKPATLRPPQPRWS